MLAGKTVLICGASRGIGAELLTQLKSIGSVVIVTSRGKASEISEGAVLHKADHIIENIDVAKDSSSEALRAGLEKIGIPIDIFCHVAGVAVRRILVAFAYQDDISHQ